MSCRIKVLSLILVCSIFLQSCSVFRDEDKADFAEVEYRKLMKLYPDQVSYIFYDLGEGKIVDSKNPEMEMIPASLHKIVTDYAALEILGPNATFSTSLLHNGTISEGELLGDLIIKAGGDPNLNVTDLYNFAFEVQNLGIKQIKGDIIYDDSYFPTFLQINNDQPDHANYNQTVSPFILDNNNFRIFQNGNSRELRAIFAQGDIEKQKKKLFNAHKSRVRSAKERLEFLVEKEAILPLREPAFYTASTLQAILSNLGISSKKVKHYKSVRAEKFRNLTVISQRESGYLEEHVSASLLYSNNLVTEVLLLHTAKALACDFTQLSEAADCLRAWYQENYPKQNWLGMHWENGSGLSEKTRITALNLNEVLKSAYNKKYENRYFLTFLPVSGVTGTLKNKFSDKSLKIVAKTGTMNYVSALAGYLFADQKQYSFVIMVNNQILREIMSSSEDRKLRKKVKEFVRRWYFDALKTESRILDDHL